MLQMRYETTTPMKTELTPCFRHCVARLSSGFSALVLVALLVFGGGSLSSAASVLRISSTGTNTEGVPTFRLDWAASSNAVYLVQSADSLAPGSPWTTLDAVQPAGQAGSYQLQVVATDSTGRSSSPAKYYRLVDPQPQIFSVEPAIVAPGVPVDLYIIGQGLGTNTAVWINGVPQGDVTFQSSTLAVKPVFTPSVIGNYLIQLVVGGKPVSSFTVISADAVANPELVLQGPPQEPPASPARKDFKGHVTLLKAFDDGSGDTEAKKDFKGHVTLLKAFDEDGDSTLARGHTKTGHVTLMKAFDDGEGDMARKDLAGHVTLIKAFDDDGDNASARGHTKTGHVTLMKAFDDGDGGSEARKDYVGHVTLMKAFDDDSDASARGHTKTGHVTLMKAFDDGSDEMREGKKGLNAVNVKLASRTVGGGDCDDHDRRYVVALMKAKEKANQTKCCQTFGVQPFSGEVQACDVDLAIPGRGLDFVWARTYHSRIGRTGAGTNGWTFSYDVRCVQNGSGGMDVYDGSGRKDTFTLQTNGTYTCPEFFRAGTFNNNTFILTFADTGRWVFHAFDGTAAAGKLIQIITRNGDTMTLGYDTGGRLAQLVDDLGRTNTVTYNSSGQPASVTDFSGRTVTYAYYSGEAGGSPGDLKSVTSPPVTGTPNGNDFPNGKTTTYTYSTSFAADRDNHLLLTITDPKGQLAAAFSYEHSSTSTNYLRCIAAQEGTNLPACYTWVLVTRPVGSYATLKCIANDPVGNVAEYFFDARNRCVIADDYTGRATPGIPVTDVSNRPSGKLRSSDPDYYATRWSWNNDSLCALAVTPGGQQMQYVYQSDFDASTPARKRADCRVVREAGPIPVDLDGDGVSDVTSRAWYYTYDPRFGSNPAARDYRVQYRESDLSAFGDSGEMTGRTLPRKGWDGTIKGRVAPSGNGMAINTKGTGADKNRVAFEDLCPDNGDFDFNDQTIAYNYAINVTDPRGIVGTGSYDGSGNLRSYVPAPVITIDPATVDLFLYHSIGQLTAITNAADASGRSRVDTFSYYTNGPQAGYLQACVMDAGGLALTTAYEYDARGNVTRVIDPRGNDRLFTYNALDECVQSQSALLSGNGSSWRIATQCAYDANDNLAQCAIQLRDAFGNLQGSRTDNFLYDGVDRLSQCALAVDAGHALTNRYIYDGNDQCVQMLGGDAVSGALPRQTVSYQYDERRLLYRRTFAAGSPAQSTDQFSYTLNGRLGVANGGVEKPGCLYTYAYDGFDRVASVTDPLGNQTVCFYDANDNLKVIRRFGETNDVPGSAGNVRLAESSCQYDALDRCVSAQDLFFNPATQSPIGNGRALTTFAYAPNGECVSVTDTLGHTTTYGYDTACRPVSITDALGNQRSVVYDACANPLVESSSELPAVGGNPQVFSVTQVYDALDRCVSATDSAGNTATCAYDSLDRCVQTTDPRGTLAFYSYDLLNRCTSSILDLDRDGVPDFTGDITMTCTWSSSSGNLLAVTDSHTNTTSYTYDLLGRCTSVTHADGTQELMGWDPRSNLISEQDANGTTITNIFDASDRIVHRDIAARNVLATTTFETFAYDGCDRLTGATNDSGGEAFAYDSLSDCTSETLGGLATVSTYDAFGNRLSLTYPGGRSLTCTYDALNRCASISDSGQQLASYAYDGPDRISLVNLGNGTRTQIAYDGFAGTANAQGDHGFGQVSRIRHGVVAGGTVLDDRTLSYDQDQNKTARNMTSPFTLGGTAQAMSFQYDPACRLVNSLVTTNGSVVRMVAYGLDRNGNRRNVTGLACSGDYTMSSTLPPGDFQMDQYTATPCDTRTYDDNGNLVSVSSAAGPVVYQYDYANRLVQVQVLDSGTGTLAPAAGYAYDALGRRISRTIFSGGLPPATTQFLYDGDCVVEERAGGVTSATYVHGSRPEQCDQGGGEECFEMRRNGKDYYLHDDDQGNALALTTTGGAVVERYDYDDYGAITFLSGNGTPTGATSSAAGNVYCWGGLRLDSETGLHNNDGGDYFEPQTGRAIRGKVKSVKDMGSSSRACDDNNPWSSGSPPLPACMKGDFSRGHMADGKR